MGHSRPGETSADRTSPVHHPRTAHPPRRHHHQPSQDGGHRCKVVDAACRRKYKARCAEKFGQVETPESPGVNHDRPCRQEYTQGRLLSPTDSAGSEFPLTASRPSSNKGDIERSPSSDHPASEPMGGMGPGCWLRRRRNRRCVRRLRARVPRRQDRSRATGAAKLYVAWLRAEGVLPPARVCSLEETRTLAAYSSWMREQRGVTESTLDLRRGILADLVDALGDDPPGTLLRLYATSCSRERRRMAVAARKRLPARRARSCATWSRQDSARPGSTMQSQASRTGSSQRHRTSFPHRTSRVYWMRAIPRNACAIAPSCCFWSGSGCGPARWRTSASHRSTGRERR